MILELRYYSDPILRKISTPVKEITIEIKKFIDDLIESMDAHNGIGLAAPQVGRLLRIFVVRLEFIAPNGEFIKGKPKVYINPKITDPSKESDILSEGCLSLPGIHVDVARPLKIHVQAMDIDGNTFEEELEGFVARQVMHENDHLNGTLIIDRCSKEQKKEADPFLQKIKKAYKASKQSS